MLLQQKIGKGRSSSIVLCATESRRKSVPAFSAALCISRAHNQPEEKVVHTCSRSTRRSPSEVQGVHGVVKETSLPGKSIVTPRRRLRTLRQRYYAVDRNAQPTITFRAGKTDPERWRWHFPCTSHGVARLQFCFFYVGPVDAPKD